MLDNQPPQLHERVTCSIEAAKKYQIPANVVLAVAEKENGRPGQWVRNKNGTHDVGPLQFNTSYLATLARYGITPFDVAVDGCYAYDLAAWRLRKHIMNDVGDLWRRAANYHSRTAHLNAIYRADLMKRAAKWGDWLAARYPTHEVQSKGARFTSATNWRSNTGDAAARNMLASSGLWDTQSLHNVPLKPSMPGRARTYVPRQLIISSNR